MLFQLFQNQDLVFFCYFISFILVSLNTEININSILFFILGKRKTRSNTKSKKRAKGTNDIVDERETEAQAQAQEEAGEE